MLTPRLKVTLESVRKLLRRNAKAPLEKMIAKLHPADIATIYSNLNDLDAKKLISNIKDKQLLADIVPELSEAEIIAMLAEKKPDDIAQIVEHMESDDAALVLRIIPDETSQSVLNIIGSGEMSEVEQLLSYQEYTAGSIMNTSYFSLCETMTVKEATKSLHNAENVDMVFYLYVTDEEGKLVGVISLRELILNSPDKKLEEIMTTDVIYVRDHEDQEDVAKIVEKYDLLAIPVVDDFHVLSGIITVDDVIDIIREEATEDIYMMVGSSDDELLMGHNSAKVAKVRLPWLIVTFAGAVLAGVVTSVFQNNMSNFAVLIPFMPIIMAMGGNVGSQSATILIRGLALGKVAKRDIFKVMMKEVRVGMIMGFVCGTLLGIIAPFWSGSPLLGVIVGTAMFAAMTIAAFTGTVVPTTLIKLNFDPAVASSPFITMLNDLIGLTIYFSVSMVLFNIFV
ncbi:magnesium transporter [Limisalsivibrio acetivorans]|uniref:magnesium transporter n=1 Tax=Limisalsivibrio acetivorans TaxID=1304888 RepID=UPI0003B50416|nr:magnesium transporter [Limisalsivibrio acetivorans]